jgi:hypothetical protein
VATSGARQVLPLPCPVVVVRLQPRQDVADDRYDRTTRKSNA